MAALRGTNSRQPARPLAIRRKPPSYGLPMGGHYHRPQKSWKTRSNGGANSSTKCRYRKGRLAVCACLPQHSGDIGQIQQNLPGTDIDGGACLTRSLPRSSFQCLQKAGNLEVTCATLCCNLLCTPAFHGVSRAGANARRKFIGL